MGHRRGAEGFGARQPIVWPPPLQSTTPGPPRRRSDVPLLRAELLAKVIDSECFPSRRRSYAAWCDGRQSCVGVELLCRALPKGP
jgi:hypothetical protein